MPRATQRRLELGDDGRWTFRSEREPGSLRVDVESALFVSSKLREILGGRGTLRVIC